MDKLKKISFTLVALLMGVALYAQQGMPEVEMADALRANGKIYVVVLVLTVIFIGIVGYLIAIDRKLRKLEKEAS